MVNSQSGYSEIKLLTTLSFTSAASQTKTYVLDSDYDYIAAKITAGGANGISPVAIMGYSGDYISCGGVAYVKVVYSNLYKNSQLTITANYVSKVNIYGVTSIRIT